MWTDAAADAPRCPGSGQPGSPAPPLADGYPHGWALCARCLRFVPLDGDGRLHEHDTFDAAETDAEAGRRHEWFNVNGW
jgi:hypothetical protein